MLTLRVAVMLAHCRLHGVTRRWTVQPHARPHPHWLLVQRLDEAGGEMDLWLLTGGSQYAQIGARPRRDRRRRRAGSLAEALDHLAKLARAPAATPAAALPPPSSPPSQPAPPPPGGGP